MEFFSIYSLLYIPLAFLVFIDNIRIQKYVIWGIIIVFTLFRGLRWEVGTDWDWYYQVFQIVDFDNFYNLVVIDNLTEIKVLEIGWSFLMLLFKLIIPDYTFFMLVTNLFILIIYYKFSFFFTNKPIIFFSLMLCSNNFFPVRQDFSIAVYMLAFLFFFQSVKNIMKDKLYFLFNFLSFLIHQSSVLLAPFYFLLKKVRLSLLTYLFVMILSYFLSYFLSNFLVHYLYDIFNSLGLTISGSIQRYMTAQEVSYNTSNPIFSLLYNCFFFWIFYKSLVQPESKILYFDSLISVEIVNTFVNCFVISIVFFQLFSVSFPSFSRICSYFVFATPILFSITYDNVRSVQNRRLLLVVICLYCLFRFYRLCGYFPELHFPYKSIMNNLI